jgi:tRNA A-37 threonylcarbamoyl transferase component Bud32
MSEPMEQRARGQLGRVLRGKYRLDRVLGAGGMAVVFKATHRNQAEFAVKMLHPELSLHEDIRQRFLREGYAANSVKHPGVVLVVDDDVAEDGAAFLVMELLDGIGCDELWSRCGQRLPLDIACAVALELLDVLVAAHTKGIVHRDLKPANLFLTRQGTVKVLDFGIARVRDTMTTGGQATGTGVLLGTPAFMAPEQATGKPSEIDARADLWAVGATVFALASGAMVHNAETAGHLLVKVATERARSLAVVLPDAPRAIVDVIDRALAFEPAGRWPTALAMRDALEAAQVAAFGSTVPRTAMAALVPPRGEGRSDAPPAAGFDARPSSDGDSAGLGPGSGGAEFSPSRTLTAAVGGAFATAEPVSRSSQSTARRDGPRGTASTVVAMGAAATIVAVLGVAIVVSRGGGVNATATSPASMGPGSGGPTGTVAPPTPLPAITVSLPGPVPAVSAADPEPSPVVDAGHATAAKEPPARAPKSPGHAPPTPAPKGATAPAGVNGAPANCDPPFFFDAAGNRIYKKECL